VRVYLYPGMTHLKAGLIDGCWGYIGTGNFDALSLRRNYEIGLIIGAGPLLADLEQQLFNYDAAADCEQRDSLPTLRCDGLYELLAGLCL
jgi:phosphatidylserine/phosphatidylglycerophosphate/cardiolipin synthase-like enzyme